MGINAKVAIKFACDHDVWNVYVNTKVPPINISFIEIGEIPVPLEVGDIKSIIYNDEENEILINTKGLITITSFNEISTYLEGFDYDLKKVHFS